MKPFVTPEADIQKAHHPRPPPVIAKTDKWEVEKILSCNNMGSSSRPLWKYYVLWKGHPRSDATWEPLKNVTSAKKAVEACHHEFPEAPGPARPHQLTFQ